MNVPRCIFSLIFSPEGRQAYRVVISTFREKFGAESLSIAVCRDGDDWNILFPPSSDMFSDSIVQRVHRMTYFESSIDLSEIWRPPIYIFSSFDSPAIGNINRGFILTVGCILWALNDSKLCCSWYVLDMFVIIEVIDPQLENKQRLGQAQDPWIFTKIPDPK